MANEVTFAEAKLCVLQTDILQLQETQNSRSTQKTGCAIDPNQVQDQINFLRQLINQKESDITKIQTLIQGQGLDVVLVTKLEYEELKGDIQEMRAGIAEMKGAQNIPATATPTGSKLFLHVDPTTIAPPEPPLALRSYFLASMQPPIDPIASQTPIKHTTWVREQPLPYGQHLIVNNSGCKKKKKNSKITQGGQKALKSTTTLTNFQKN